MTGRAIQHDERLVQSRRQAIAQTPVGQVGQGELQPLAGGLQLGDMNRGAFPRGGGHPHDDGRGQARGALGADAVCELMGLIDDQNPMLGQHPRVARHGDAEHGMVGDDHIGRHRCSPGELGEALLAQWAGGAQALGSGDRNLRPGAVRHTRDEVVAVPGGGLGGPLAQPDDLLSDTATARLSDPSRDGRGAGGEKRIVSVIRVRIPALKAMAAHVVLPSLEQRDGGSQSGDGLDGVGGQGGVLGQDLPLKSKRGRGHDRPLPGVDCMDHHGYEVSQGFAGARTGLHQQVGLIIQRFRHASSHLDLSGARGGAETIHSRSEDAQGAPAGAVGVAGVAGVVGVIGTRILWSRSADALRRGRCTHAVRRARHTAGGRGHGEEGAESAAASGRAAVRSSAARAASARPTIRVPVSTYSTTSISPSVWTRETRSPRE